MVSASHGTLQPGAWGDLTAVALAAPPFAAAGEPEAAVAWSATASDVVFTAVAGRVVYTRGDWPGVRMELEREAYERAASAASASRRARAGGILGR